MLKTMVPLLRLSGVFLLILVGVHWINLPMGFSVASSVATVLFAFCLIEIYPGYSPNAGMWVGWLLIITSCLMLAMFDSLNILLLIPAGLFIVGYRMAALPFDIISGSDAGDGGGDVP